MGPCTVCGERFTRTVHCAQAHPGVCHGCSPGFAGAYGYYDHADPEGLPQGTVALSPAGEQALARYLGHARRTPWPPQDAGGPPTAGRESQGDDAGREGPAKSPTQEPIAASVQSVATKGRLPPSPAVDPGAFGGGPAP